MRVKIIKSGQRQVFVLILVVVAPLHKRRWTLHTGDAKKTHAYQQQDSVQRFRTFKISTTLSRWLPLSPHRVKLSK